MPPTHTLLQATLPAPVIQPCWWSAQVAYNQAMASCSWEQAWACFHSMRRAGLQPNTRSYNAVRHTASTTTARL